MATRMKSVLETRRVQEAVPAILTLVGEPALGVRFAACVGRADLPQALGEDLGPVADHLEQAAITPGLDLNSPNVMDFATALRLYGPERFRRGGELDWELTKSGRWVATADNGADWDIARAGDSWGVTIARWDRPDWYVESLELGKLLVAEIIARPSFPRHSMEKEIPFD